MGSLCSFHSRNYIVKIHTAWRVYSTKKRVNLFKTLPEDVWKHILHFIHLRNNTAKLLESHEKVYSKRILFMENIRGTQRSIFVAHRSFNYFTNNRLYDAVLNLNIENRDYIRKF